MAKLYTNEAWLKKRYWLDKKSPEEIAKDAEQAQKQSMFIWPSLD